MQGQQYFGQLRLQGRISAPLRIRRRMKSQGPRLRVQIRETLTGLRSGYASLYQEIFGWFRYRLRIKKILALAPSDSKNPHDSGSGGSSPQFLPTPTPTKKTSENLSLFQYHIYFTNMIFHCSTISMIMWILV